MFSCLRRSDRCESDGMGHVCNHVHRCYPNGGVQVVRVAEYIWKVCHGHNKFLVFKVPCYATTSVSQKLLDFFVQLKHV